MREGGDFWIQKKKNKKKGGCMFFSAPDLFENHPILSDCSDNNTFKFNHAYHEDVDNENNDNCVADIIGWLEDVTNPDLTLPYENCAALPIEIEGYIRQDRDANTWDSYRDTELLTPGTQRLPNYLTFAVNCVDRFKNIISGLAGLLLLSLYLYVCVCVCVCV